MGYLDVVYRNIEFLSFPIHITGNTFVGPGDTDPDVQISCFRFFMEELRSRWCKGHQP
jgi:hypothetical protein